MKRRNNHKTISIGDYTIKQYIEQKDNSRTDKTKLCKFSVVVFKGTKKIKSTYLSTQIEANKVFKGYETILKDAIC